MADQLKRINFEELINDDILHVVFSNLSMEDTRTVMQVNGRWKDVCLHQLRTRTRFDDHLYQTDPRGRPKSKHHSELMEINRMLELMPALKVLTFDFTKIKKEDWMALIDTITIFNPLIQELYFSNVHQYILEGIIKKIGPKIKILHLLNFGCHPKIRWSLAEGFPNLEELKLDDCNVFSVALESTPSTLKKLTFYANLFKNRHLKVIKALRKSPHSLSIEHLYLNNTCPEGFELICEHFRNLKAFKLFVRRF